MSTEKMSVEQAFPDLPVYGVHADDNLPGYTGQQMREYALAYAATLIADKLRLDWLEENEASVFRTISSDEFGVISDIGPYIEGYGPTLREALDRAREVPREGE